MPGDRMRREVEEIIEKEERRSNVVRMAPPSKRPAARSSPVRLTPGALMLGGLVLVLAGLVLDSYRLQLVLAALALFSSGYIWSLQRRSPVNRVAGRRDALNQPHWRGEQVSQRRPTGVVQFNPPPGSRIRRWFRRK